VIQATSLGLVVVTAASAIAVTQAGWAWAYANASVVPHDHPAITQRFTPRCSRRSSISAIR
jgi:hypothetical protein